MAKPWKDIPRRSAPPASRGEAEEKHPIYGPCDGFGPHGECSECGKENRTDDEWLAWLHSKSQLAAQEAEREWADVHAEWTEDTVIHDFACIHTCKDAYERGRAEEREASIRESGRFVGDLQAEKVGLIGKLAAAERERDAALSRVYELERGVENLFKSLPVSWQKRVSAALAGETGGEEK